MSSVDKRISRIAGASTLGVAMLAGAGALAAATHPAAASAALNSLANAVSCATSAACVSGTNSSTGPGVAGTGANGAGVQGTSKSGTGVSGTSTSGTGVYGYSTSGTAVYGNSTSGIAVYGNSTSATAVHASNDSNSSPAAFVYNYGTADALYARSDGGTAIYANAAGASGTGVISYGKGAAIIGYGNLGLDGEATSGSGSSGYAGVRGYSDSGYGGYFGSNTGYGAFANVSNGVAFVGRSGVNASDIQGSHIGLLGRAPTSGFPLVLTDATPNTLLQVDGYGNLAISGSYQTFASTFGGGKARAFSPKSTLPTVEDTGTAQLVSGVAVVRLDPTFAASIDSTTAYRVFVTPAGDTRGLFVATRTPAGFVVRESQAGRSTVAFDYRIVATALGQTGQRMARINAATDASIARAPLPMLPAVAQPASLKPPAPPPVRP